MAKKEFLGKDYKLPTKGNYMKFQQGQNRFRVLDKPIIGWEWWIDSEEGRKPVRTRMNGKVPPEFADGCKHFWAMVVWNYNENRIQILEITQKSIQAAIKTYSQNEKWGAPYDYDLVVTREGEGLDTEYTVIAEPKEELSNEVQNAFKELSINIEALFSGEDPFAKSEAFDVEEEFENIP